MRRKNRRISLNTFQPQCDLKPYLETYDQALSTFQTSLMLMQILKKHQKLMFKSKQNQIGITITHFQKQNQILTRIKQKIINRNKKQKVLASSYKVLQELDINRKYAYQTLEQQNKQIADRIYALETALSRMENVKKSQSLSVEYLQKLQIKVKNRKNVLQRLNKMVEQAQQKNQDQIDQSKKIIDKILKLKYENTQKLKNRKISSEQQKVEDLLEAIYSALQNQ